MEDELIKEICSSDSDHRVEIIRRATGIYLYQEFYFSRHPGEMFWTRVKQKPPGIYESAEHAESEARSNVDWLIDESRNLT
jgi:hypothetical protein